MKFKEKIQYKRCTRLSYINEKYTIILVKYIFLPGVTETNGPHRGALVAHMAVCLYHSYLRIA